MGNIDTKLMAHQHLVMTWDWELPQSGQRCQPDQNLKTDSNDTKCFFANCVIKWMRTDCWHFSVWPASFSCGVGGLGLFCEFCFGGQDKM